MPGPTRRSLSRAARLLADAEPARAAEALGERAARSADPRDRLLLAVALADAGRFAQAEPHFDAALRARPDGPAVLYFHGRALFDQGRPDEALARFDRVLAFAPANDAARALRGLALLERGDGAGTPAIDAHGDPGDPAFASRLLVFVEQRLKGLYHPAVADASVRDVPSPPPAPASASAKGEGPGGWRAFVLRRAFHRALQDRRDERFAAALAGLFRVLEGFRGDPDVLVEIAETYFLLRRWDDALAVLDRVPAEPPNAEARALRGLVLYASGRAAEAEPLVLDAIGAKVEIQATDEAIDLAPASLALYYAGRIALAAGDRTAARLRFAKLSLLDPTPVNARWEEWKARG
jgi:tetratricopeptide (TPR) repeat protein